MSKLTTGQRIDKYKKLRLKLSNPGQESSFWEICHNDELTDEMESLIEGFPECVKQAIKLGHI